MNFKLQTMRKNILTLLFIAFSATTFAQISSIEVDELVNRTLKTFNVPGIAVAIIKDGKYIAGADILEITYEDGEKAARKKVKSVVIANTPNDKLGLLV